MRDWRGTSLIVAALLGASLTVSPAAAGRVCKPANVSANGWSSGQAVSRWSAKAKSDYGAAWSSFNLAANKRYSYQSFIFSTLTTIIATPCRKT